MAATAGSAALDEVLFDGIFHDQIALAGKALTAVSVATYCYQRIASVALDRSLVSYALRSHLEFAFERAVVSTRHFQHRLMERLDGTVVGATGCRDGAPSEQPLLPISELKRSLHDKGLTQADKLAKWAQIRRYSLASMLVVAHMRSIFVTACSIRNTLVVLLHLEDQNQRNSKKWEVLSRLKKAGRLVGSAASPTDGNAAATLLEFVAESLGGNGNTTDSPFAMDGPEGPCATAILMDMLLAAAPPMVSEALRVVDATLTQIDGIQGKCNVDDLSILLDVVGHTFRAPVDLWTLFMPIRDCVHPSTAHGGGDVLLKAVEDESGSGDGQDGGLSPSAASSMACIAGDGVVGGRSASAASLHREGSSGALPHDDDRSNNGTGMRGSMLVREDSSLSSSHNRGLHHSFHLPQATACQLAAYLHDVLCASSDFTHLADAVVHATVTRYHQECIDSFANLPAYVEGKRAMIVAVTHLDMRRQKVASDEMRRVPPSVQAFCRELLKGACRSMGIQ